MYKIMDEKITEELEHPKALGTEAHASLLNEFPNIDAQAMTAQVNRLFTPYLFVKRGNKSTEWWSSCCMQHGALNYPPRTVANVEYGILCEPHNGVARCPVCGRALTLKETRHLGKKKSLEEYQPVVFLNEKGGDIYARAYWSHKSYLTLDEAPKFFLVGAYKFSDGMAVKLNSCNYYGIDTKTVSGNWSRESCLKEPFTDNNGYVGYYVIGMEQIQRSRFRYCGYEQFEQDRQGGQIPYVHHLMSFLGTSSIYPRQIEMLMKTGFKDFVYGLVVRGMKNRKIIDWKAKNYLQAFGLSKQEMRAWKDSGLRPEAIGWYKQLRSAKLPESFESIFEISRATSDTDGFISMAIKKGYKPSRLLHYLQKQGDNGFKESVNGTYSHWKDWLSMAEQLGYDTEAETIIFPTDLFSKHDEAAAVLAAQKKREQEERDEAARLAAKERFASWREKYNIETDGYFIRIAESAEEIRAEGKAQQHCVAGYAERHMAGQTTILFLRACDAPDKALYTIEMNGNRLFQIHGFQNERGGAPDPRKVMAWMLDPWLKWIQNGSKRTKDGRPKLPAKRKEHNAA